MSSSRPETRRLFRFRVWHLVAIAALYLLVVQGVTLLTPGAGDSGALVSIEAIAVTLFLPLGLGIMLLLGVASVLRMWDGIFVDSGRASRRILFVPAVIAIAAIAGINYSGLAAAGPTLVLLLLVGAMMVGFGEEFLYRGIAVAGLRSGGYSEVKVAVWSSVIFGLGHGTNVFLGRPDVIVQMVSATIIGFAFYLVRRATGSLVAGVALHGLWDFSVMSAPLGGGSGSVMPIIGAGLMVASVAVVLIWRKQLFTEPSRWKKAGR